MILEFEGLRFVFPSSTLLIGPMAAAKPLFALKLVVKVLSKCNDCKALIFATSSPRKTILKNLKVFQLSEDAEKRIIIFDHNPLSERVQVINSSYYLGNFSDPRQLKKALLYVRENDIVVIPSFTLLLIGTRDKIGLAKILIKHLLKKHAISLIAVNSAMFREVNEELEKAVDNVIIFTKKGEEIYFKPLKFKGETSRKELKFKFPKPLFERTKKKVALRTSEIIKNIKRK